MKMNSWLALAVMALVAVSAQAAKKTPVRAADEVTIRLGAEAENMSAMGRMAYIFKSVVAQSGRASLAGSSVRARIAAPSTAAVGVDCSSPDPSCTGEPDPTAPLGGQAEMSIAVDASGMNVVIGFNDTRGFSLNPVSVSGYAWSNNGGLSFTDGGQLPAAALGNIGATNYPQVFGDPDVKYVPGGGGCQFIYASIMVVGRTTAPAYIGTAQTMSIHRSTDCGHTWAGPFEVTSATNPSGVLTGNNARDAADKEFIDVDPDTGRVLMSWTNFAASTQIRTTFSDNIMSATPPTWSAGVQLDTTNVQGSIPRFAGNGSSNVYVAWFKSGSGLRVARSTNNGATFGAPITVGALTALDQILGSDRVNNFPSMAVDTSTGPYAGNVYIVTASNVSGDRGADVLFSRSTDGGATYSALTSLTPVPGADRSQWFPSISVDKNTGRVNVIYFDQSVDGSGDLTDMTWTYSDDGGATWSRATSLASSGCVLGTGATDPLNCRPFRAGFGNDAGQPNIGDYIGTTAQGGVLYATWGANPRQMLFTDIQPAGSWPSPDFMFNKGTTAQAALRALDFSIVDSGGNGFADAGDQVRMTLPLKNFVTNASLGAGTISGITGTLSTSTPGVSFQRASVAYPNIAAGGQASNSLEYVFTIAPNFVPGTKIEFALNVATAQGNMNRLFTMNTGTPVATTVFSENFDGVAAGTLPTGWGTIHQGGNNTVPWTTNNTFCTTSNGLFHTNADDGASGNHTRFERATSPNITIPSNAGYVTLEFDICYNTEDQAQYESPVVNPVLAWDGAHLRITDFTSGRLAVATWVEAFAEEFTTGSRKHFPKHLPRSSDTNYFQDISTWAGNSGGVQRVRMKFAGMQGSTIQLRPDYTQDSGGTCATPPCGVKIDNIVIKSVTLKSDELKTLSLRPVTGSPGTYTATVTAQPLAPAGGITVALSSSNPGITSMPASVTIPAGAQTSAPFTVTISPATVGTNVTITATGPSNARSGAIAIR